VILALRYHQPSHLENGGIADETFGAAALLAKSVWKMVFLQMKNTLNRKKIFYRHYVNFLDKM